MVSENGENKQGVKRKRNLRGAVNPNNPKSLIARMRQKQAVELRIAGFTLQDIADSPFEIKDKAGKVLVKQEHLYANTSSADKAIRSWHARFGFDDPVRIKRLEADRLDRLQRAVWQRAVVGDDTAVLNSLRIQRQRQQLFRLNDAPSSDAQKSGIDALVETMRAKTPPPPPQEPDVDMDGEDTEEDVPT